MASNPSNSEIVQRMIALLRNAMQKTPQVSVPTCDAGFTFDDFTVTYPNNEIMASAAITGAPSGATIVGVTVAAAPSLSSSTTYCMGVASDSSGLTLPVSVLGASTSASFPNSTTVTGLIVICYTQAGSTLECTITQQFTVGG